MFKAITFQEFKEKKQFNVILVLQKVILAADIHVFMPLLTSPFFVSPQSTRTPGLRPMAASDVQQVTALLQKYLSQFHLQPVMGEEEVQHWFLPQENIIDTYVVEVQCVPVLPQTSATFLLSLTFNVCFNFLRRIFRPGFGWHVDRLYQFLHAAVHSHAPPAAQKPKSSLLFL